MKKSCIIYAILVLCLLITGCASTGLGMPQQEAWSYQLSTRQERGEQRAEDGRVVASYDYEVPEMTVLHQDGTPYDLQRDSGEAVDAAKAFNDCFAKWLTERQKWFADLAQSAMKDYALRGEAQESLWNEADFVYVDEVTAAFWQNDRMACVTLHQYSYTGGAHGYGMRNAKTFDMSTGTEIHISDLTADQAGLQTVVEQEILRQAQNVIAQHGEATLFEDYTEVAAGWLEREVFFGDDGMSVVFAAYDMGPYASGEQAFTIPYEMVAPYLNDYGRELLELN